MKRFPLCGELQKRGQKMAARPYGFNEEDESDACHPSCFKIGTFQLQIEGYLKGYEDGFGVTRVSSRKGIPLGL